MEAVGEDEQEKILQTKGKVCKGPEAGKDNKFFLESEGVGWGLERKEGRKEKTRTTEQRRCG